MSVSIYIASVSTTGPAPVPASLQNKGKQVIASICPGQIFINIIYSSAAAQSNSILLRAAASARRQLRFLFSCLLNPFTMPYALSDLLEMSLPERLQVAEQILTAQQIFSSINKPTI